MQNYPHRRCDVENAVRFLLARPSSSAHHLRVNTARKAHRISRERNAIRDDDDDNADGKLHPPSRVRDT